MMSVGDGRSAPQDGFPGARVNDGSASTNSIPAGVVAVADYEREAARLLSPELFAHIAGGVGDERGLAANREALAAWHIHARPLVDCRHGSTATRVCGHDLAHPILLAPVAYQQLVHPAGELATAQAAEALDTTMVVSALSSTALEPLAAVLRGKWFQLYFQRDRAATARLLARAEGAGFSAVVVTVDAPVAAMRYRAARAGFRHPAHVVAANCEPAHEPPAGGARGTSRVFEGAMAGAPTWRDLEWLRGETRLPLLVKGVLHPDDVGRALALGMDGAVISNHGGRALDDALPPIAALPVIRAAVGPDVPLLIDGGFRTGGDVFKALALGANAVLVGRPQLYALAVAGPFGVAHMLRILRDELEVTMALAGCPTIGGITRDAVARAP